MQLPPVTRHQRPCGRSVCVCVCLWVVWASASGVVSTPPIRELALTTLEVPRCLFVSFESC